MYTQHQYYHYQMQHPYYSAAGGSSTGGGAGGMRYGGGVDPLEKVARLASESAVVIFSLSTCCMCHAVKRLFCGMGVSPTVIELDTDPRGSDLDRALLRLNIGSGGAGGFNSSPSAVPLVFVGGKLVGGMERVMASHIAGTLVPLLKEAGALWL